MCESIAFGTGEKFTDNTFRNPLGVYPPRRAKGFKEAADSNLRYRFSYDSWARKSEIQRFRSGVKNSRVIELHNTNRYVFIVDEALIIREMRKFLLDE